MSPRWLRLALCLAPLLASCASTARITGDFGEYRSYRQARLATTLEERLGASERYLRDYPNGTYREEVRSWFAPEEKRYFKLSWNNVPRLRAYLDAMPRGPHAEAVTDRITELETRGVFAARREQRILDRAQSFETRLADAATQRREFLHELSTLALLVAATRSFGEPTAELPTELLKRFRERHCAGDVCTKVFSFEYSVPENRALAPRSVQVTLEVILERGLVQQLALSGPELFTRVAEAVTVRAVPPSNAQARAEALGQAADTLADALEAALPKGRCDAEAVSPILLAKRCDGVRADVVASTEPGEPDRLVVRAETARVH